MKFINETVTIVRKDILLELRGKEVLSLMIFLSLLFLVIFNFALDLDKVTVSDFAPGILWVVFAFSGIIGMGRTSMVERDEDAYLSIIFSPASAESFFTAKVISNLLFLLTMEVVTVLLFAVLFDFEKLVVFFPRLLPSLLLGSLGFSIIGTLFSFLSTTSRYGEFLLPFLFLPVVAPILLGGVTSMDKILSESSEGLSKWTHILIVFDVMYMALSLILFRHLLEE